MTINIDLRIDDFMAKIDGLGNNPTYSELAKVKEWYESQTELVKNHIKANVDANTKIDKLMKDFNTAASNAKEDVVNNIGSANTIEEIKDAKRDYGALPEEVKKDIPADVVKKLEEKAANAKAAEDAKNLLDEAAKPGASYDDKSAAVDAYEKLTDDQKALISGSESGYNDIKADVDAIDKVIDLIDGVKKPYTKEAITEARGAYDNKLDADQKAIFPADKKAELDGLTDMLSKAEAVENQINALTQPYSDSQDAAIKTAKGAYDKLTDDEKVLVDPTLKTKLDTLYKDMVDSKNAEEKAKIEAEKKFTDKVNEVLKDPTLDKIKDLIEDKGKLPEGVYNGLPDSVKEDVTNLEKAKDIIEALDKITKDNIVDENDDGKLSQDAKDALDGYTKAGKDIQDIVDKATDNKADDIDKVGDALDKISKIPVHKDEEKNDKGEVTKPATGVGEDCQKPVNGSHDKDDHQKAIEDAKDALNKLPDSAKDLIPEDKKEQVEGEYKKLLSYFEYKNRDTTSKTEVEVDGLTNKVEHPADSGAAGKTVLEVVATDSRPGNMPKTPAGKNEVLSVDVKLVAKIYTNKDDEKPISMEVVQPKDGKTVTVKLLIPSGYDLETLEIWHVKDNGSRSRITQFTLTTQGGKTYAVFEVASFSHFVFFAEQSSGGIIITPPKEDNPFADVKKDNYFYEAVQWAVKKGITDGMSPSTFAPDATCTRAQAVTFLWRAAGEPKPASATNPFKDVKADAYYYNAVLWAVEKGITDGMSPTTFEPDSTVTRAQSVTFLWRYAGNPISGKTNPFADVKADAYYYNAVLWAVEKGITDGMSPTAFVPDQGCTRAQSVTFLHRHFGK